MISPRFAEEEIEAQRAEERCLGHSGSTVTNGTQQSSDSPRHSVFFAAPRVWIVPRSGTFLGLFSLKCAPPRLPSQPPQGL